MLIEVPGVVRIREDERNDLLLLLTATDMTAVGFGRNRVADRRIALDDLKVVAIDDRGIVCTGYDGGEFPSEFVVDPADQGDVFAE